MLVSVAKNHDFELQFILIVRKRFHVGIILHLQYRNFAGGFFLQKHLIIRTHYHAICTLTIPLFIWTALILRNTTRTTLLRASFVFSISDQPQNWHLTLFQSFSSLQRVFSAPSCQDDPFFRSWIILPGWQHRPSCWFMWWAKKMSENDCLVRY